MKSRSFVFNYRNMFCLLALSSLIITSCTQDPSTDEEYRRRWGGWYGGGGSGGGTGGGTTTNPAPTVNAGTDKTITLPTSTVTLAGTASDANGTIASYSWTKVSGTGGTIATPATASTSVTGLTQGTYVFNLKVTDNQGATANDNVTVTVNSTTTPPPPPPTGGGSVPAGYTLAYQNGFNSSSDISSNQLGQGGFTSTIKSEGAGSFRSMVNGSSASNISSGWRSEQQYGSTQTPTEGIVEYDSYYQNWGNVGGNGSGHVVQWHPNSSSGSAVLSLSAYTGKFDVVRSLNGSNTHQSGSLMTIAPNTWYKLRWEYKFSTGSDGYVRLYINGNLYYSFNGATTTGGTYLKLGQNRWSYSGGAVNTETVIYYDNLKVYKKG